jgi:filamentous hemagglutinin family protein
MRSFTEAAKMRFKGILNHLLILGISGCCSSTAFSNPVLNSVTNGQASISQSGNTETVNQTSAQAILQWNSFNIGANEKTQFVQPNSSSVALNRINPSNGASQIYGQLSSNGKIILINGAGIHFGPGAQVNVGSLIASTSDITNENFLAGNYNFNIPSSQAGSIINEGSIRAADYGLVALLGNTVQNSGLIKARLGAIALGAGSQFTLSFSDDSLINFAVSSPGNQHTNIKNTGKLLADGGQILVTANAATGVLNDVIDMSGVAVTNSVRQHNGEIILSGSDNGIVRVSGRLIAAGKHKHNSGGKVIITGNTIDVDSTAMINVSGSAGGGTVEIGGSQHGNGPLLNADYTNIAAGSIIDASALSNGSGGNVVIWSNNLTNFAGAILANGGVLGGNGGSVETSSANLLSIAGGSVSTLAPQGTTGNWLLDPANVNITTVDSNETGNPNFVPTAGANTTTINVTDIETALLSSNVTISTTGTGTAAGTITVSSPITWSTANSLSLTANTNITINAPITMGSGSTLTLDSTGTSGTININSSIEGTGNTSLGNLNLIASNTAQSILPNSSAVINVNNFTLEKGEWYQDSATLPNFTVANDFSIYTVTNNASYNVFNSEFNATFTRFAGGNGSTSTPYLITDIYGMQGAGTLAFSNSYNLVNNIDATVTKNWTIGNGTGYFGLATNSNSSIYYSGKFNGENDTISNLYMNYPTAFAQALFGAVSGATISNLGIINPNITGLQFVGALVGNSFAGSTATTITNCYVSGGTLTAVSATATSGLNGYVGGLVGVNRTNISDSYSTATVIGSGNGITYVGGLVGNNFSGFTIQNSYSTGSVISATGVDVGGFAGGNAGTIKDSYSIGQVSGNSLAGGFLGNNTGGSVTNNYFNKTTAGISTGVSNSNVSGVTALTSTQMLSYANFAGFNFTSGSPATWAYESSGYAYPILTAIAPGPYYNPALAYIYSGSIVNGSSYNGDGIALYVNGTAIATSTVASNGTFSLSALYSSLPTSTNFLIALTSGGQGGVVDTTLTSAANITSLSITVNDLMVGDVTNNSSFSNTALAAAVGNTSNLLYSAAGNNITLASGISMATLSNINYNLNGNINASGASSITFHSPITVAANPTVTTANGNITFGSSVTSTTASNLMLSSTAGAINLNGVVSGIANLTTDSTNGNVTMSGNSISTSGNQIYESPVILDANTTLTTGGNIMFDQGVSGTGENLFLVGNAGNNNFTLTGNAAVNNLSITGNTSGNNNLTLQTNNTTQNFNITATNSGNISGIAEESGIFIFNNIQNLSGGNFNNSFTFANGGRVSGAVNGGTSTTSTNTMNYSANAALVNINLNGESGTTITNGNLINQFTNINNIISNGQTQLNLSGTNTLVITGADKGYVNDPVYFSGINSFSASSSSSSVQVQFTVPETFDATSNTATVNSMQMKFNNINLQIPTTAVTTTNVISPVTPDTTTSVVASHISSNAEVSDIITQGNTTAITSGLSSTPPINTTSGNSSQSLIDYNTNKNCNFSVDTQVNQRNSVDIDIDNSISICR